MQEQLRETVSSHGCVSGVGVTDDLNDQQYLS